MSVVGMFLQLSRTGICVFMRGPCFFTIRVRLKSQTNPSRSAVQGFVRSAQGKARNEILLDNVPVGVVTYPRLVPCCGTEFYYVIVRGPEPQVKQQRRHGPRLHQRLHQTR